MACINIGGYVSQLAARIAISNLHKNTKKSFSETYAFLPCGLWRTSSTLLADFWFFVTDFLTDGCPCTG